MWLIDSWDRLGPAWQACFLLAWESFQAASTPVGAVLVDGRGSIVTRGRSRRHDAGAPAGSIGGSNIAHAEINALATLPPGDYPDHVLYTTLEPCFLCTAALRYSHVDTVRYAAPDPMWYGVDRLPELNHHLARRLARREGPLGGPFQAWAAVLHLISAIERDARSVVDCHAGVMPAELRLAQRLATGLDSLRSLPLLDALSLVGDDLDSLARSSAS